MAETTRERINRYVAQTIAEEESAADAARRFESAAPDPAARAIFVALASHSTSQQQQMTALLDQRGGPASTTKKVLARLLWIPSMTPQIGQPAEEKTAADIGLAIAVASTHAAMYEALAVSAAVTGDTDVSTLAQSMRSQEQSLRKEWTESESRVVAPLLQHEIARANCGPDVVALYLDNAIATERSIESQLRAFAKEADDHPACQLFTKQADETRSHFEQLTRRLQSLGKEPSLLRGFLSQVFNFAPKLAHLGLNPEEHVVENLIASYGFVSSEAAMFSTLALLGELTADDATAALAGGIRQQKEAAAPLLWAEIAPAAQVSIGIMPYATNHDAGVC